MLGSGLRFSKKHPSKELGGMAKDTVPMSEVEKEDPRLEYSGTRACEQDQGARNNA